MLNQRQVGNLDLLKNHGLPACFLEWKRFSRRQPRTDILKRMLQGLHGIIAKGNDILR
ncbi:hypothetical protein D3C80_2204150 [compost metagenome]